MSNQYLAHDDTWQRNCLIDFDTQHFSPIFLFQYSMQLTLHRRGTLKMLERKVHVRKTADQTAGQESDASNRRA